MAGEARNYTGPLVGPHVQLRPRFSSHLNNNKKIIKRKEKNSTILGSWVLTLISSVTQELGVVESALGWVCSLGLSFGVGLGSKNWAGSIWAGL